MIRYLIDIIGTRGAGGSKARHVSPEKLQSKYCVTRTNHAGKLPRGTADREYVLQPWLSYRKRRRLTSMSWERACESCGLGTDGRCYPPQNQAIVLAIIMINRSVAWQLTAGTA